MSYWDIFKPDPVTILKHREEGMIYAADFGKGSGRYISSTIDSSDPIDVQIQISPKVEVRIAYIFDGERVRGLQVSKLSNKGNLEKINLSTLDWSGVLGLLKIFSEMDLKILARKNLILNENIVSNPEELESFLKTISADPQGKEKLVEIVRNFNLLKSGDIDEITERRESVSLFGNILSDPTRFSAKKFELDVNKDEEVWQRFFKDNVWILGADFIEILDERRIDTGNITDYIVKSYDGFADIIELKLPGAQFWNTDLAPNSELTKALMQCMRYLSQIEKRINDLELNKKLCQTPIVKPRITLIYGRSTDWTDEQREAYRILNASFHSISILTYDHVFERANRISSNCSIEASSPRLEKTNEKIRVEDIPF